MDDSSIRSSGYFIRFIFPMYIYIKYIHIYLIMSLHKCAISGAARANEEANETNKK